MKGSHGEVRSKLHDANMEDRIFWSSGEGFLRVAPGLDPEG